MPPAASAAYRRFLLAALPLLGLLGLASGASALTVLAAVGALLLLRSFRSARLPLRQLDVQRRLYPSAFEDDAVAVELALANHGRRAVHLVEIADAFGASLADRQLLLEPGPLRGRHRRRLLYRTACSRAWGVYAVGPLVLRAADPLGLFEARRSLPRIESFAVFPQVRAVSGLERLGARRGTAPEQAALARPGRSQLLLGIREYRPGDDTRRIHWPATARHGAPMVKEQELELIPYLSLFVDLERTHRAGTGRKSTLEYVVRTAACLVWSALRGGDLVQVFGEGAGELFVPPGRGDLHLARCLDALIRARQQGRTPALDVLERHSLQLPGGSTAAILFATISVDTARLGEALSSLRARGVRPLLLFVNKDSFMAIEQRALAPEEVRARIRALEELMLGHGVEGAVLSADQELADELGRPDLFGPTA